MQSNYETGYSGIVERIKDRLDIVDVVQSRVILKKSGNNYWGLCPFHDEKTPSFSVNPQKQIYKCFGCGEGGDVISFLMKTSGQNFVDVIKEQAQNLGLEIPSNFGHSNDDNDKKRLLKILLESARNVYMKYLLSDNQDAITAFKYLESRQISTDIIEKYGLGFAPKSFDFIQKELSVKYSLEDIEACGLIIKRINNKGFVDRFRNRIMIPIYDEKSNTIAFGARAVEQNQNPKYLNSPDTLIYNKSKILYGIHEAKDYIKFENSVLLMEGYFDVISSQVNGIGNCVASCGTSLTYEHVKLISKYCPSKKIYLCFDTDTAGQKATDRNAQVIKKAFEGLGDIKQFDRSFNESLDESLNKYCCELRVVSIPQGKDPDEFIKNKGSEQFKELLERSPLLLDYQLENLLNVNTKSIKLAEKLIIVKKTINILKEINNKIIRSEYVRRISQKLDISEESLIDELDKMENFSSDLKFSKKRIVNNSLNIEKKAQKNLLGVYLLYENNFDLIQMKEIMRDVNFIDKDICEIKNVIDKLVCRVNNVKELTEELYSIFAQDEKKKQLITDAIFESDRFKGLNERDFLEIVRENVDKIKYIESMNLNKSIKKAYKSVDNEKDAIEYQLMLKEHLKKMIIGDKKE